MRISIVGLGKLGSPMAAAIASRGHTVFGVDTDHEVVKAINCGWSPVWEPGLQEMLKTTCGHIYATADTTSAVLASDVTFVIVPTPSREDGAFSLELLQKALEGVGEGLRVKAGYHLVVVTSTVLPGATRHGLIPVLEHASNKSAGLDFGVCYSPEFIALGDVIHNFLNPDLTLVGEFDRRSGDTLEECYQQIVANGAPCKRMSLENAELAKVALNSFVTTKIVFANVIEQMCANLPGGDVDAVTDAIGTDHRIGKAYLRGGLGFGGPCFPRDNKALSWMARQLGVSGLLFDGVASLNEMIPFMAAKRVRELLDRRPRTVAVLGLSYKPGTPVVEHSHGLELARLLLSAGFGVTGCDPLACEEAKKVVPELEATTFVDEAVRGASLVVVATPDPIWEGLSDDIDADTIVLDCWRYLEVEFHGDARYHALGRADEISTERLTRVWK